MALQLQISEGQVYYELSMLEISIVDAFEKAGIQGDSQATRFIEHHLHTSNRGVRWDRLLPYEGSNQLIVEMEKKKRLTGS